MLFSGVDLGGRKIPMAVGRREWPLLLADLDADGELSDEKPVKANSKGEAPWIGEPQCSLPAQAVSDPDVDTFPFRFSLNCVFPGDDPACPTVTPRAAFMGTAKLGGVE